MRPHIIDVSYLLYSIKTELKCKVGHALNALVPKAKLTFPKSPDLYDKIIEERTTWKQHTQFAS